MRTFVSALAVLGTIVAMAMPALAHDRPAPAAQTSVFPVPRDPWRSWGNAPGDGRHRVWPRPESQVAAPSMIWVPGQWVWNGAAWQWFAGRWTYIQP